MPLLDNLLALIAPHDCLVCGQEGALICKWCAPDAFMPVPSRCYRCKRLTTDYATCSNCRRQTSLKHVWIATDYQEIAQQLLHKYKFERAQAGVSSIGTALENVLPHLAPDILIIPVPTATSRVRQRGYDQVGLLARYLARQRQLVWTRAVTRLTQSRQVGSGRQQRLTQLQNAFLVTKPKIIEGAHILLVDDVVTTGATLEAVSRVLKQAGAKTIDAVVFAQKQ